MVQINFALKEVNCKVVYYGPGLSGKTTNLEVVHSKAPTTNVGELTSIATEGDRTLFFDFLPLNLGQVAGMTTKFQIYTVPGQVYYNSTRKLVLQGTDGIVFVADSRKGKMDENIESLSNLEENLREYGMDISTIPLVLQYNKRDLPDIYAVEEINARLNRWNAPFFEAVAVTGEGVFPTLKKLSSMVLESLNRQQGSTMVRAPKRAPQAAREPEKVAVGATGGGGSRRQKASGSQAAANPPPTSPAKSPPAAAKAQPAGAKSQGQPAGAGAGGKAGAASAAQRGKGAVIRDRVVPSPDVKPIERKSPPVTPASAQKRQGARLPTPKTAPKEKKLPLVWIVVGVLIVAAGAAVYFSGLLNSFLK